MTPIPHSFYDDAVGRTAIRALDLLAPGARRRRLAVVFLASLGLRALVAVPAVLRGTVPKFDEVSYFRRAVAFANILGDAAHLRGPAPGDADTFYDGGYRPPFHSVVLSLGLLLLGRSVAAARVLVVLLSALTTVLVLLVAERLGGARAGLAAAALHAVHPSFLAFSHYLWSETTFILLLVLAVHLSLVIADAGSPRRRASLSLALGLTLGCLAFTRLPGLFPMLILPAWIFMRSKTLRARLLAPALASLMSILAVLPWEYTLLRREGAFVLLANNSFILYSANNPWRDGQEDDLDGLDRLRVLGAVRDFAAERSTAPVSASLTLALREVLAHPGAFVLRCAREALNLWTFDFFPLRQVLNVAYPPMPPPIVLPLVAFFLSAAVLFPVLVLKGLMVREARLERKALLLVLVAAGMAPYVITFGNTRFNLPQVALLLPIAGFGLAHGRERRRAFLPLAALLAAGAVAVSAFGYRDHIAGQLRSSSAYAGPVGRLDRLLGTRSLFADGFFIETAGEAGPEAVTLALVNADGSDYAFKRKATRATVRLAGRKRVPFFVYAYAPRGPLRLRLSLPGQAGSVELTPTSGAFWDNSRDAGLGGLRLRWRGGR